jgi:hypothetical protein
MILISQTTAFQMCPIIFPFVIFLIKVEDLKNAIILADVAPENLNPMGASLCLSGVLS